MKSIFEKLNLCRCVSVCSIFVALLFISFSAYSQKAISPKVFEKAHKKLTNSVSGFIKYTYKYTSPEKKLKLNVELFFIKQNNTVKSCYIKQYDDFMLSEYVYYNDTLFSFSNVKNKILSTQNFTLNPFEQRDNKIFVYLIDGSDNYLTAFLQDENYKISKANLPDYKNILQGESSKKVDFSGVEGTLDTKILLNKKTKCLHSLYQKRDTKNKKSFPVVSEFEINSIKLYNKMNPEVESVIHQKYLERR